ncbi:MAG: serine hydrolase domain-containing protein [Kineosporiaceae bacterium]
MQARLVPAGDAVVAGLIDVAADGPATSVRLEQVSTVLLGGIDLPGVPTADVDQVDPRGFDAADAADLDRFVTEALRRTGVPGAAVAVVQGDEVVHLGGYGVASLETGEGVDPETPFRIGSVGKSMTTATLAVEVDRGVLAWDQPVTDVLPGFALADPADTACFTVETLVCNCSGIQRADDALPFTGGTRSPEQVIEELSGFAPITSFGEVFGYNNQVVSTGGWAAAAAAGADPERLDRGYARELSRRLLRPAGMTDTTLSRTRAERRDAASPHGVALDSGAFEALPGEVEDALGSIAPAGGAHWSTAEDMARYLQLQLGDGMSADGRRVVSQDTLHRTWTPRTPTTISAYPGAFYGLGWFVEDYYGTPLVSHGGNTLGFTSEAAFLPEQDLGVVVLANAAGANALTRGVRDHVVESLFDLPAYGERQVAGFAEDLSEPPPTFEPAVDAAVVEPFLETVFASEGFGTVTLSTDAEGRVRLTTEAVTVELRRPTGADANALVSVDVPLAGTPVTLVTDEAGRPAVDVGGLVFQPE